MDAKYLGKPTRQPIDELDVFPAPKGVSVVTMTSDEVASLCPVTGQPDFYTVSIAYRPGDFCIESKSLKLFLWGFRDKAGFAEEMTVAIRDRVVADAKPAYCSVTTRQKARGGISIETVSEYESGK